MLAVADPVATTTRATLLRSPIALVEDLRSPGVPARRSEEDYSPDFQVCLPYRGLFVWHVGGEEVVGDAVQVLFVAGGESFHLSQPIPGDYAEVIVTPCPAVLEELAGGSGRALARHPLFRRRSRLAEPALQHRLARFMVARRRAGSESLADDEAVVTLLRTALQDEPRRLPPTAASQRLIRRAKAYLHAHLAEPIRLIDVARAAGASPAYLTHLFSQIEGAPLHRYLTRLRLSQALVDLPRAEDLSALALGLGFSSHSHFTAAFRRAFGTTPSAFRVSVTGRS